MKQFFISYLLLIGLVPVVNGQGFLKTSGQKIVDEKGKNIILRGMGLGGWMLQEGYMLKLQGINPQYSIRNRIEQLIGTDKTKKFYEAWLANFTTKADIDSMRKWGFNSVRLPMHYNLYTLPVDKEPDSTRQTWIEEGFRLTDSLLSWCKANEMYLILDLHAAPGGQGNDLNISDRDSTKPSLWQSEANKAKTIALWKKLAERYKDEPWIGAYDIINEPNWGFDDPADKNGLKEPRNIPLRDLMVKITDAIRSVDKKHIVIIEGNGWGNNYKGVFPLWDDNIVISFHKYWNYNDPRSIQHMVDARNQNNAPVWVGETGENSNTWFTDAVQLFESNNIGWCWWPLKKLGNNNPLEVHSNPKYNLLLDYWNGYGNTARPSESDAFYGLMELASQTNVRYNSVRSDVIDALIRQPFDNKTTPFAKVKISPEGYTINAVDYDLGRNGIAYYDKDTGNYHVSTGRRSAGNKGRMYRNDGVDIYTDSLNEGTFYVGSIQDGEWLQYTVDLNSNVNHILKLIAAGSDSSNITVNVDGKPQFSNIALNTAGNSTGWQTQSIGRLKLKKGRHVIRLRANKGGFTLKQLVLSRQ
ncbi:MAG TPA: cellulase family glycosylhydrolase [Chitinophagaceae bacterium]